MFTVISREPNGPSHRSEGTYTGELWRDLFEQDRDGNSFGTVFFTPCGRTFWHSHPGGQLLVIEHGEGLIGDDERTVRVRAGDIVWTPPGSRHWHGATSTRSMTHLTVTFAGVEWQEEVSDEHYTHANEVATR